MERLQERIQSANKALNTLSELVILSEPTDIERDAAIQRFEYSFETCWRAAKQYLFHVEGIDIGSPKGIFRCLREVALLSEDETILGLYMVDHRNSTVHTYNEKLANEIFTYLPKYYRLLKDLIDRIENRM